LHFVKQKNETPSLRGRLVARGNPETDKAFVFVVVVNSPFG
jgi:hypothetical protein